MSQRIEYVYYGVRQHRFFNPNIGWIPVHRLNLVRTKPVLLRFQLVDRADLSKVVVADDGKVDNDSVSSISDQENFLLALKTEDEYETTGSDFSEAWSGFTADASWADLTKMRFSVRIQPTTDIDPDDYRMEMQLLDEDGSAWVLDHDDEPLESRLTRELITGDETSTPAGLPNAVKGKATILEGNSSVDVAITGLTVSPVVQLTLQGQSGQDPTTTWYTVPVAGTLRIHSGATADALGYIVDYKVQTL